jgi:hypothetical protein
MIHEAIKASSKLKGTAIYKRPSGNTPILPITTHMSTKPTNQERKVVWIKVNFLERIKIAMANNSDHKPQMAPLTGAEGNTIPSPS